MTLFISNATEPLGVTIRGMTVNPCFRESVAYGRP